MSGPPGLLEIGRIDRPHGIRGGVLVRMLSNNPDRLAVGARLVARIDGVDRVLTIDAVQAHQDRWLVEFAGVHGREGSEAVAGAKLLAEPVVDDPDSYWVHDLVGADVVDTSGATHGTVVNVIDNPASDILELDTGLLVPLRFAQWDPDAPTGRRRLVVDGPVGLLDGP
jgi:16S rRNA processing protein RimM